MPEWSWLCGSIALNGWLFLRMRRLDAAARRARIEAEAEKLVTKVLAEETARKLGPRKVARLIHATENTIRRMGEPKESEI